MNLTVWWPEFKSCVENLQPSTLDALGRFYAERAAFQDPFHSIEGRDLILRSYASMFKSLHAPRFESLAFASVGDETSVAVRWVFRFSLKAGSPPISIPGSSWLRLSPAGEILLHEDHWDASLLLDAFPVVGPVTRYTKTLIAKRAQSAAA